MPAITPIVPYDGSVEAQSTDQEISNSDKTYVTSKTSVIFNGKSEVIDINRGKVSSGNSFYIKELTNEAFELDVFGAPTFLVNNKLFWGQDRLEYAIDELKN